MQPRLEVDWAEPALQGSSPLDVEGAIGCAATGRGIDATPSWAGSRIAHVQVVPEGEQPVVESVRRQADVEGRVGVGDKADGAVGSHYRRRELPTIQGGREWQGDIHGAIVALRPEHQRRAGHDRGRAWDNQVARRSGGGSYRSLWRNGGGVRGNLRARGCN